MESDPSFHRPDGAEITSGFFVVKRFEALYREFAAKPVFDREIYAIPLHGTSPEHPKVRYRGIDRDALTSRADGMLAEARLWEFNRADGDWADDFVRTVDDARDVLAWAEMEAPGVYEPIWIRLATSTETAPSGYALLGYEPTDLPWSRFSVICDCMCFPRWHGTDPEGILFRRYFDRLNSNGLFDDPSLAAEFLEYYLSFPWTERGEFVIAGVWAPAATPSTGGDSRSRTG